MKVNTYTSQFGGFKHKVNTSMDNSNNPDSFGHVYGQGQNSNRQTETNTQTDKY